MRQVDRHRVPARLALRSTRLGTPSKNLGRNASNVELMADLGVIRLCGSGPRHRKTEWNVAKRSRTTAWNALASHFMPTHRVSSLISLYFLRVNRPISEHARGVLGYAAPSLYRFFDVLSRANRYPPPGVKARGHASLESGRAVSLVPSDGASAGSSPG